MFPGPLLDHELMHLLTKQGILAQFNRLPEAGFVEQVQALLHIVILLVLAMAMLFVCLTDRLCQDLADVIHNLSLGDRVELLGHGIQKFR